MMTALEEIKMLEKQMTGRYLRWEMLNRRLQEVGFPYKLVQECPFQKGKRMVNLYFWTGSWGKGAIYVQETEAGRYARLGVRHACDRLITVLRQYA